MTISYTTLVAEKTTSGSIANWINRSDLPVEDILTEAQAWVYARLRAREMVTDAALPFSAGSASAALPSDFLDPIQLVPYAATVELPYVSETALQQTKNSSGTVQSGTPARWSVIGATVKLDVAPSSTYGTTLIYYAKPADLSGTNLTNFLTTRYPDVLRYACMALGFQFAKDKEAAAAHFAAAEKSIAEINAGNDLWRRNQRKAHASSAISYTTLVADRWTEGSIKNWADSADVPSEVILVEAQAYIYERLRVREMVADAAVSLSAGQYTVAVPTGFLDPVQFLPYASTTELPYVAETALVETTNSSGVVQGGTPSRFTVVGTNLKFDVRALSTYAGRLTYYALPTSLSSVVTTNFLTTRYPTVLRLACLAFAFQATGKDDRAAKSFADLEKAIVETNATNELWRRNQRKAHGAGAINYTTLVGDKSWEGSIRNWVDDANVPADLILTEAQAYIYERMRTREMMLDAVVTITSGQSSASVPTGFLDPIQFLPYGATNELPYVTEKALGESTSVLGVMQSGTPSRYTIIGSTIKVDVAASADFAGRFTYYGAPTALGDGNTTNFLTTRYPTTLRLACLAFAYQHLGKADLAAKAFGDADKSIAEVNTTADLARRNQRNSRIATSSMSYTQLTADKEVAGSIRSLLDKSDVAVDLILSEAQSWIYERLRVREMISSTALTVVDGASTANLPADFLDPIAYRPYGWGAPLLYASVEMFAQLRDTNGTLIEGTPSMWSIVGTTFTVDVTCDGAFSGILSYYARPANLSGSSETNWLTSRYPSLLRHAILAKGFEHTGDSNKVAEHTTLAEAMIVEAAKTNEMYRRGQISLN